VAVLEMSRSQALDHNFQTCARQSEEEEGLQHRSVD
jgi:hypothetical protein